MHEVGDRAGEVAGNFKGAVDKSVRDQPVATLAMAAAVGFVLGAPVAVPFVIAGGFALSAITVMLVGGLALISVVAAIVVSVKEHEEQVAEQQAEAADTEEVVSEATAQALVQTPIALLGAL